MDEWVKFFLGGGVALSIVEGAKALIGWLIKRKAAKEDRAEERAERKMEERMAKIESRVADLEAQQGKIVDSLELQRQTNIYVLYDRIRYLAKCYIQDGEISFEDRDSLNQMHTVYHQNGGNGNLDKVMKLVNGLPLKKG